MSRIYTNSLNPDYFHQILKKYTVILFIPLLLSCSDPNTNYHYFSLKESSILVDGAQLEKDSIVVGEFEEQNILKNLTLRISRDESTLTNFPLYTIEYLNKEQSWHNICEESTNHPRLSFFAPVKSDHTGKLSIPKKFEISCLSGSIAKCYRSNFSPEESLQLFQTCVRMFRADYCGDGRSFTEEGNTIYFSSNGKNQDKPSRKFEAVWGPDGVRCLENARIQTLFDSDFADSICGKKVEKRSNCRDSSINYKEPTIFNWHLLY